MMKGYTFKVHGSVFLLTYSSRGAEVHKLSEGSSGAKDMELGYCRANEDEAAWGRLTLEEQANGRLAITVPS